MKMGAVLVEGKKDHKHKFVIETKEWDRVVVGTDDPERRKLNTWHYNATIYKCKCGREELTSGTVLIPVGGDFLGGEYALEPDGSRGHFIS